ncbi:hypothetical protein [Streptomyces sp. NPDC002078]
MTSHVEQQVAARIAAARQRAAEQRQRREELAEARQHGLAARHAQKLGRQAANDLTDEEIAGPVGYLATCLAHIRGGYPIEELDVPLVLYVAPTQTEVDQARRMVARLAALALKSPAVDRRPASREVKE